MNLNSALKGIDVSRHDGEINWEEVKKSGIDFVIIRAGYGNEKTQKDSCFEINYTKAKEVGIPIGVYWYSYASDASDAFNEANTCLEIISGKQYEYPIFYDIEEKNILSKGKSEVSQIAKNFCTTLKNNNYLCGIYASSYPLNILFDDECKNNFPIWVAHYDVDKPKYNGNWGIWQYTSQGNLNGINGKVDLNHGVINYEDIIKNQHLNGY